jgi:O-antigen/teichoic acid export membrane protein
MAAHSKVISALHANWWINLAGVLVAFGTSIVLVRSMPPALFAEYGAVLAMIGVATLVFEAGANSGLTRYLTEASHLGARRTFYRRMQARRWFAGLACAVALIVFGPMYARSTQLASMASQPWVFVIIGVNVAFILTRLLAHYGLLALFETKVALLRQQIFMALRSLTLAALALAGCTLMHLLAALLIIAIVEAAIVHRHLSRIIGTERAPLPPGFVNRAQVFGLATVFDKACAMLGSGTVLLLFLAPLQPAFVIALLALSVDLVGKAIGLTVMPMGNLVAPYLSHTGDAAEEQAIAVARVVKLSSLLYSFCIGAAILLLPHFVPAFYGATYASAAKLTLLLLLPAAFENWVRGCCSPALLRNGRSGVLMKINILQAIATIVALVLVRQQSVEVVIVAVGGVRAAVASLNLLALRPLVTRGTYRVPLQSALLGAIGCALAYSWVSVAPLPPVAQLILQTATFALLFYVGVRWIVFRDHDTLHLAHRIAGNRVRFLSRLLPPLPSLAVPNA